MVQTYILIYTGIGWKIGQEVNPVTEFELLMCRLQHRFVRKANAGRDGASPAHLSRRAQFVSSGQKIYWTRH